MIPDPVSLELAAATPWRYERVHAALATTAAVGVPPEVAAGWVRTMGPRGATSCALALHRLAAAEAAAYLRGAP